MSTLNEALAEITDMMAASDDPLTKTVGVEIADVAEKAWPDRGTVPRSETHRAVQLALVWAVSELTKVREA